MKVTYLRYLDAKFHHPSLGASSPNRGNRISCVQNSKTENRNSVNNSGIGILCSKNSNERLAFSAVAGLLVYSFGHIVHCVSLLSITVCIIQMQWTTTRIIFVSLQATCSRMPCSGDVMFSSCPVVCPVPTQTHPQGWRVHYTDTTVEASDDWGGALAF